MFVMGRFIGIRIRGMGRICECLCPVRRRLGMSANVMFSKVYISFGGLLLLLDGPYKKLSPLRQDYVYMLLKK